MSNRIVPEEYLTLITTGQLTPEQQDGPVMQCIRCEQPMTMFYLHPRVSAADIAKSSQNPLPGAVWGKDVACVCRCCSFAGCKHKDQKLKVVR